MMHHGDVCGFPDKVLRFRCSIFILWIYRFLDFIIMFGAPVSAIDRYRQSKVVPDFLKHRKQFGVNRVTAATAMAGKLVSAEMW
jgi:hypothetical protein